MSFYLISGLPGTGKSTIGNELAARGFEVVDADAEFGYFGHLMSETPVEPPRKVSRQWFAENGWLWDVVKVRQMLSEGRNKPVFVVGGSRNERKFYRSFDKVFILHIPDELLVQRLKDRNHERHSHPDFIKRMRIWNLATYDQAKNIGATVVETEQPLDKSVEAILGAIDAQ